VSQSLSTGQIEQMRELIVPLESAPELEQALDLHAQSLNHQETRLRAFMAAWNALEHFTFAVKNKFGPLWEAERDDPNSASARLLTLNSIPDASSGKLAKAFGKMAWVLGGAETAADIAELLALKDIRNDLSHELKDKELPVERVQALMDKYLKSTFAVSKVYSTSAPAELRRCPWRITSWASKKYSNSHDPECARPSCALRERVVARYAIGRRRPTRVGGCDPCELRRQ
jgi:hypothetical protein